MNHLDDAGNLRRPFAKRCHNLPTLEQLTGRKAGKAAQAMG